MIRIVLIFNRPPNPAICFCLNIEAGYKKANEMLDELAQSILTKAFRRELVPQDPDDEPASVLLKRIRAEKKKISVSNK